VPSKLCFKLEIRCKLNFCSTHILLQRLFQYSITRGLLVTLVQICILVFIFVEIEKLYW